MASISSRSLCLRHPRPPRLEQKGRATALCRRMASISEFQPDRCGNCEFAGNAACRKMSFLLHTLRGHVMKKPTLIALAMLAACSVAAADPHADACPDPVF